VNKNAEYNTEFWDKKEYVNATLVKRVGETAERILALQKNNRHRDRFFPLMIDHLGYRVAVEVGVDRGGFAERILSRSKIQQYFGIDPWIDDFGSDYKPKEYDKDGSIRKREAVKALTPYMNNADGTDRAILMQAYSADACLWFEDGSVDFCYIDGDHSLEGVYDDLHCWVNRVRIGGMLAGHDYKDGPGSGIQDYWGDQLPYRIKAVVDDFCLKHGFKLHVVGGRILSWWFVKNKEPER